MSIFDSLAELRASSSQSPGTENGTGKRIGPSGSKPYWLIVDVTSISGGTLDLHLADSDDDSTYYDISGSNVLDPSDGAIIDAVGRYYIPFVTDREYIRTEAAVATSAVTWNAFVSSNPPV